MQSLMFSSKSTHFWKCCMYSATSRAAVFTQVFGIVLNKESDSFSCILFQIVALGLGSDEVERASVLLDSQLPTFSCRADQLNCSLLGSWGWRASHKHIKTTAAVVLKDLSTAAHRIAVTNEYLIVPPPDTLLLCNTGNGASCSFSNLTICHSHPLRTLMVQVCGSEKESNDWTLLSSSFFSQLFLSLFMCTNEFNTMIASRIDCENARFHPLN